MSPKPKRKRRVRWLSWFFIVGISLLICFPAFVIVYHYVPMMKLGSVRVDHVVTFIPMLALCIYVVIKFRMLFYIIGSVGLVWLMIASISGHYTFVNLKYDYLSMMYALKDGAVPIHFLEENEPFTNEDKIRSKIEYNDPEVLNYARQIATTHFLDLSKANVRPGRIAIQSFSIFKEVQRRWIYVHDPPDEDYYSSASETLEHLDTDGKFKGDCDDYSIFMAACVKAVGGTVRLVRTRVEQPDGPEVGHMYPEVYIGDEKDLEAAVYLIKEELFYNWAKDRDINYHIDRDGGVWLNFDYNDEFPGGSYQSNLRVSEIKI